MKQRVAIALLTVLLIGAGYFAGVWTERHRCKVPPPPAPLLGELSPQPKTQPAPAATPATTTDPRAARLAAEIERLRPQIDEFRTKLDAIDLEMDRRIAAILRPEQQDLFQALVKRGEEQRARENEQKGLSTPLTADEIRELQQRPLHRLLSIVVVPIRLEWNTKQLKLDAGQREQLAEILRWRREKFIELVDVSPPPSLTLSKLAPLAQRLVHPAAENQTEPQK